MPLMLYDTLRREEVAFVPAEPGRVGMYVCGPTVQGDAHVGHGRAAVVFDVLRRHLAFSGYAVRFVQNVTDIDDKIILRARREGVDHAVISTRYARAFERTMDALGVLAPDVRPLATGHLLEMQELITRLIAEDKAYAVDGDVFFRVRSFPTYGALSNRRIDDLVEGADVVDRDRKEDPLDFALWKSAKPEEPSWPSPWGPGRPGWHIECSAMAATHLGAGFDIHGGGLDLVFPHHENEIAQHEAAHDTTTDTIRQPDARTRPIVSRCIRTSVSYLRRSIGSPMSYASPVHPHAHVARPTSIPASFVVARSMRCLAI